MILDACKEIVSTSDHGQTLARTFVKSEAVQQRKNVLHRLSGCNVVHILWTRICPAVSVLGTEVSGKRVHNKHTVEPRMTPREKVDLLKCTKSIGVELSEVEVRHRDICLERE